MDALRLLDAVFREKLIEEKRIPLFSFQVHEYHVEFLLPNYLFFAQVFTILALQMIAGCILSVVMYYGIVMDGLKREGKHAQRYLIGYGLVIPACLAFPFWIMDCFDIRGLGLRLGLACLPMTVTLKCFEVMHGFGKKSQDSLWEFVVESGFMVKPFRDQQGNLVPANQKSQGQLIRYHVQRLLFFAIMYHIFEPFQWYPLGKNHVMNNIWITFDVAQLYNTFIQAYLLSSTLAFSVSGVALLPTLLTGVAFDGYITNNPMFFSTSPSNFWGRRWNSLIHTGLKQGVYKPVRWNAGNRTLASFSAFAMSGLYHELVWKILFTPSSAQLAEGMRPDDPSCCLSCYCGGFVGKQTLFFCWNGALIVLEYLLGDRLGRIVQPFPSLLKSHLVVMLSLPVGHLFTADMMLSGYLESIRQALPLFLVTKVP